VEARAVIAYLVTYRGRVQGVGFRYTAQAVAGQFAVSGTVRNCADGSVELFVQGEQEEVTEFLDALAERMLENIVESELREAALAETAGFHIIR
jgi:acylphosphatase